MQSRSGVAPRDIQDRRSEPLIDFVYEYLLQLSRPVMNRILAIVNVLSRPRNRTADGTTTSRVCHCLLDRVVYVHICPVPVTTCAWLAQGCLDIVAMSVSFARDFSVALDADFIRLTGVVQLGQRWRRACRAGTY